jgi:hypothetical protein
MAMSISSHQKRKGGYFLCVEIPDVRVIDSIGIIKIFLRQKEGHYNYYLYIYILTDTKFYYLSYMDLKGSNLS